MPYIVWISRHKCSVVRDLCLDKAIVIWIFPLGVFSIDKNTPNILMANTAGIASVIDALDCHTVASVARRDDLQLLFCPLRCLVNKDDIPLNTLCLDLEFLFTLRKNKLNHAAIDQGQPLLLLAVCA